MARRLDSVLKRQNASPLRLFLIRLIIGLVGALVVGLGLVLVPLPGPGWAIVILGLAILAIEFIWARRLLGFTRWQVYRWTSCVAAQNWPMRIVIWLLTAAFVTFVAWASIRLATGVNAVTWIADRF